MSWWRISTRVFNFNLIFDPNFNFDFLFDYNAVKNEISDLGCHDGGFRHGFLTRVFTYRTYFSGSTAT